MLVFKSSNVLEEGSFAMAGFLKECGYNDSQIDMIKIGVEAGFNEEYFVQKYYDAKQMKEILIGLDKGLEVSVYAKPYFTWEQMNAIRKALELVKKDKLGMEDVLYYADPRYFAEQIKNFYEEASKEYIAFREKQKDFTTFMLSEMF